MGEAAHKGDYLVLTKVSSGTVASGEILQLADGRAAVYTGLNAAVSGDTIGQQTAGVFSIASASATTFALGAPVYWDSSASLAVAPSAALDGAADFYLGTAVKAKTSGQLTVDVDLNVGWQRLRPFVYEFDCQDDADSAVHTLIPASMNPSGLQILSVIGIVSEVFAGTEDQGVVTIKDTASSPATICTLTATDAGADAVGDVIQAAGKANAIYSVTGTAVATVTAGLGVTGAVTQETTGAAAGKMKVYVTAVPLA